MKLGVFVMLAVIGCLMVGVTMVMAGPPGTPAPPGACCDCCAGNYIARPILQPVSDNHGVQKGPVMKNI